MHYLLQTYVRKNPYSPNIFFTSNSFRDRKDGRSLWHTHLNTHFRGRGKKISVSLRPGKETLWESLSKIKDKTKKKKRRRRTRKRKRKKWKSWGCRTKRLGIFLIVEHSTYVTPAENYVNAGELLTALTMKK